MRHIDIKVKKLETKASLPQLIKASKNVDAKNISCSHLSEHLMSLQLLDWSPSDLMNGMLKVS